MTGKGKAGIQRKSAARLAAVQALYEMEASGNAPDPVLRAFIQDRWQSAVGVEEEGEAARLVEPDGGLLATLVRGVTARQDELDAVIGPALGGNWSVERLESLMRNILRAGVFELLTLNEVPAKVIIAEYIKIGDAFYGAGEPSMINGVLDRIARVLRPQEVPHDLAEARDAQGGG